MSADRLAARLTGELLAAKGSAAPTSRPARVWRLPTAGSPAAVPPAAVPPAAVPPAAVPPAAVRPAAAAPLGEAPPAHDDAGMEAMDAGEGLARFSVRLDPDRHLRLKLMAAHARRSRQDIVVAAIDRYLAELGPLARGGGCPCLGPSATPSGPARPERQV